MDVEKEIQELREKNQVLERLVQQQAELIEQLRAELASRDSSTSHSPPSQDSPKARAKRKKKNETRKKSSRKRGGQPGHKGHHRQMAPPERVDEFITCTPSCCTGCGAELTGAPEATRRHQVWEVPPPRAHVTEYRLEDFVCECGTRTRAQLPEGVSPSSFGPRVHAICGVLRVEGRLSVSKTRQMMRDLFELEISTGAVSAIDGRLSEALEQDHHALHQVVQDAEVVHLDETMWYLAGKRHILWGAITEAATYVMVRARRDTASAKTLVGEDFEGLAVTDRYCAYHWLDNERRQMCWAHLRRDFAAMSIRDGTLGECGKLLHAEAKDVLRRHRKVREGNMPRAEFEVWARGRKEYVRGLLKQASMAKGPRKHTGVARETLKYFECLWTFVEHPGVEPTNNAAERALRHPVIARKLSFGSQSDRGLRFIERMLSVRATLRQQGRSFLEFLYARLTGQPTHLLPA